MANNPSMVVRVAANLAELRRNLAEGKNQIEATTAGMQKLATSFQGDRIVQQAHNVAAAVQSIGGASKLTESEQARVNRTIEAALAKYQALGQEAPQALRDLANATKQTEEKTSLLTRGVQALIAAFSIRAVVNATRDVLEFTGSLADLAGKAGISTEAMQRLAFVTAQSGVPIDLIASGAVKMGRALVEGDKSAVAAVNALHLNVSELIAAGPERAFLAIGEAIAKVPNPMEQAALAVALFGRTGADFLPAFSANMSDLASQAPFLRDELVQMGDNAGDAIGRLSMAGRVLMAEVIVPLTPAITLAADWLGQKLPAALGFARDGIDALLRKGLELQVWLFETGVAISQTITDVPVLGRVFGQASGDLEWMKQQAQFARDALNSFNAQGVQPVKQAVQQTAPLVTTFGNEVETAGTKARRAADTSREVGVVWGEIGPIVRLQIAGVINPALTDFETHTNNAEQALQDLRDELYRVQGAATQIAPVLSNSMKLPWDTFKAAVQDTGTQTEGFFSRIFGGASGLGSSVSSIFQAAFTGGGGALGAVQAFATQTLSTLLGMIPGIGQFAAAFAGPIIAMLSHLGGKVKDFFNTLFGGPSQGELNDRRLVQEWEDQVIAAFGRAEDGTERWQQVLNAANRALGEHGYTAEEIADIIGRLWRSSQEGGEETWRVIDELNRMMARTGTESQAIIDRIGDAIDALPDEVRIRVRGEYEAPDIDTGEGYAGGTISRGTWMRDFGRGTPAMLHGREAVVREDQAPAFARAVLGTQTPDRELIRLLRQMPSMIRASMIEAIRMGA